MYEFHVDFTLVSEISVRNLFKALVKLPKRFVPNQDHYHTVLENSDSMRTGKHTVVIFADDMNHAKKLVLSKLVGRPEYLGLPANIKIR